MQKTRGENRVCEKKDPGTVGGKQLPIDANTGGHFTGARPRVYDNKDGA